MVTKATFVGENFTRKPAKFERFIRPMGLRYKKVILILTVIKNVFTQAFDSWYYIGLMHNNLMQYILE